MSIIKHHDNEITYVQQLVAFPRLFDSHQIKILDTHVHSPEKHEGREYPYWH